MPNYGFSARNCVRVVCDIRHTHTHAHRPTAKNTISGFRGTKKVSMHQKVHFEILTKTKEKEKTSNYFKKYGNRL